MRLQAVLMMACLCAMPWLAAEQQPGKEGWELDVTAPDTATRDAVIGGGFIVDDVAGLRLRIYASDEEKAQLEALGCVIENALPYPEETKDTSGYHTFAEIGTALADMEAAHPDICRRYSIGTSILGRDLWVLEISNHPGVEEDEPEFKYTSSIHGDEPLGMEMCLRLCALLTDGYGTDTRLTELVDTTSIHIMPMMNPDGYVAKVRYNNAGLDMNRSFTEYPEDFTASYFFGGTPGSETRTKEVRLVMDWSAANSFVLSANFHGGSTVVNYPYDDDDLGSVYSPSPDEYLFRNVSLRYSENNPPMYNSYEFPQGITNGAEWYTIDGGMQDWNYRFLGDMDVTIELDNSKWPAASTLPAFWENNREAMLSYMEAVHIGARGVVTDRITGEPIWAAVFVDDNAQAVYTDPDVGDYHRLLLPGTYNLLLWAPGYIPYHMEGLEVTDGPATRADAAISDGDVDGDGDVDDADIRYEAEAVVGAKPEFDGDVDGRGAAASDIQAVINKRLGLPIAGDLEY